MQSFVAIFDSLFTCFSASVDLIHTRICLVITWSQHDSTGRVSWSELERSLRICSFVHQLKMSPSENQVGETKEIMTNRSGEIERLSQLKPVLAHLAVAKKNTFTPSGMSPASTPKRIYISLFEENVRFTEFWGWNAAHSRKHYFWLLTW